MRALVARAEAAAETKDIGVLKALIAETYMDSAGQNKRAIVQLLAFHLLRNESIHLLTRISTLAFPEPAHAAVTVFVAMASQAIPRAEVLSGLRADLYRFEFTLVDQGKGDWQVTRADWRPAEPNDFL